MPTYKITDPNTGKVLRVTGDSPPSEQELEQIFASQQPAQAAPQPQEMQSPLSAGIDAGVGAAKDLFGTVATLGSGIVAEPVAGMAGLVTAPFVGTEEAQKNIEATRQALTIDPMTEGTTQNLQAIGGAVETGLEAAATPLAGVAGLGTLATGGTLEEAGQTIEDVKSKGISKTLGDFTLDLTGSPAAATAVHSIPALAVELIGLKGLQNVRRGTRLIDDAGRPTKTLRKALDKRGLDYDSLSPEAKSAIPNVSTPDMLPGANVPKGAAEDAIIQQIKAGGRENALAGLKVTGDRVGVDKLGTEAMKQGFEPGVVQSVKTSSPATKLKMRKMVSVMRQVKKSARKGVSNRPSDIVGDSITGRVQFIRDKANVARKELDDIAGTKLKGKEIELTPVTNKLQESLGKLDVELVDGPNGAPIPEFKGSLISKDKTSQRVITDLIDLLGEGGKPDALRAHKLKRQLDIMIDFNKKSAEGLTDAGRGILKDIRKELNTAVRNVDSDYARVNDTLSQSLGALDDLDDAVGTIDIFGKGANKALGTRMRALLSNQQGRIKIDNAVQSIDDTVLNLGGKFDDNIKDLVMFSDALDNQFGTVAKTSFAGQTAQGVKQGIEQGLVRTGIQKVAEVAGKGAEKLRGVNEFNAFESINSLLGK